eukprot:scaffold26950_cov15-Tisochrysis_lutea.AAC.1
MPLPDHRNLALPPLNRIFLLDCSGTLHMPFYLPRARVFAPIPLAHVLQLPDNRNSEPPGPTKLARG